MFAVGAGLQQCAPPTGGEWTASPTDIIMLGAYGSLFFALCFVSHSWGRLSVTVMDRDYSHVKPSEVLVTHIQRILDSMGALRVSLHPRVRHLYELLRRDAHPRSEHGARLRSDRAPADRLHALDFHKTLRPKYDVNKLNRIFTTEANF